VILIHLAAHTGLRLGELANLRRSQYVKNGHYLTVLNRRTAKTKTRKSRRVDLFPCCVPLLETQLDSHEFERIFPAPAGGRLSLGNFRRRVWYPLITDIGYDNVDGEGRLHFHDLRHSHITSLLDKGWPVGDVADRVGHASAKMTLDVYRHAIPGNQRRLIELTVG
jgi:integrase